MGELRTRADGTRVDSTTSEGESAWVASHEALFAEAAPACAVCDGPRTEEADDGYDVAGRGLLMWARGDERRFEEPTLCPACAAAIGVSALRSWEIEEEEG